jgi:hypothetical protein
LYILIFMFLRQQTRGQLQRIQIMKIFVMIMYMLQNCNVAIICSSMIMLECSCSEICRF